MEFAFISAVLATINIFVIFIFWNSKETYAYGIKTFLDAALFLTNLLIPNYWLAGLWAFLVILNFFGLIDSMDETEEDQPEVEATEKMEPEPVQPRPEFVRPRKPNGYWCAHCGVASPTNHGNCKACGAPLSYAIPILEE